MSPCPYPTTITITQPVPLWYNYSYLLVETYHLEGVFCFSLILFNHYIWSGALYFWIRWDSKVPPNSCSFCFSFCFYSVFIPFFTINSPSQYLHTFRWMKYPISSCVSLSSNSGRTDSQENKKSINSAFCLHKLYIVFDPFFFIFASEFVVGWIWFYEDIINSYGSTFSWIVSLTD